MKYHSHAYGLPPFTRFHGALRYSKHALDQANKKHITFLPAHIRRDEYDVFEIEETRHGNKYAVRMSYNNSHDLCLVIENLFVVTVWLNHKTDTHRTLNKRNYDKPA